MLLLLLLLLLLSQQLLPLPATETTTREAAARRRVAPLGDMQQLAPRTSFNVRHALHRGARAQLRRVHAWYVVRMTENLR